MSGPLLVDLSVALVFRLKRWRFDLFVAFPGIKVLLYIGLRSSSSTVAVPGPCAQFCFIANFSMVVQLQHPLTSYAFCLYLPVQSHIGVATVYRISAGVWKLLAYFSVRLGVFSLRAVTFHWTCFTCGNGK